MPRMSSGKYVDLSNLRKKDLNINDIETSLNQLKRFLGHHDRREPLTVAQHSLLCYWLAEDAGEDDEIKAACFCHDFSEAYVGDIPTPVKELAGNSLRKLIKPIETVVNGHFCPNLLDQEIKAVVKKYDLIALEIERRAMWKSTRGVDQWPTSENKLSLLDGRDLFDVIQQCHPYVGVEEIYKEFS